MSRNQYNQQVDAKLVAIFSNKLAAVLATDQYSHAKQQANGTYEKTPGAATKQLIERTLDKGESIAIYQKNRNATIKWVCFDFDILKTHLDNAGRAPANAELNRAVQCFCQYLKNVAIPYLLEFSGNRGFHIWLTFDKNITYQLGHAIVNDILERAEINHDQDLIDIDLFSQAIDTYE
jgi:hypothetical protein